MSIPADGHGDYHTTILYRREAAVNQIISFNSELSEFLLNIISLFEYPDGDILEKK
jgi:hypothetical protein